MNNKMNKEHIVNFRLTQPELRKLDGLAALQGMKRSGLLREIVKREINIVTEVAANYPRDKIEKET